MEDKTALYSKMSKKELAEEAKSKGIVIRLKSKTDLVEELSGVRLDAPVERKHNRELNKQKSKFKELHDKGIDSRLCYKKDLDEYLKSKKIPSEIDIPTWKFNIDSSKIKPCFASRLRGSGENLQHNEYIEEVKKLKKKDELVAVAVAHDLDKSGSVETLFKRIHFCVLGFEHEYSEDKSTGDEFLDSLLGMRKVEIDIAIRVKNYFKIYNIKKNLNKLEMINKLRVAMGYEGNLTKFDMTNKAPQLTIMSYYYNGDDEQYEDLIEDMLDEKFNMEVKKLGLPKNSTRDEVLNYVINKNSVQNAANFNR